MFENEMLVDGKDAARIAQFQLNMALETESLELDSPLVHQAVEYLLKHPQYGYYLANRNSEPTITGSLLCTFENKLSWWIQSVYVDKPYRKQGIFTSLFQTLVKLAKEQSVKQISLYAESSNERAMDTYRRLGMYVTNEAIYGYDLVYSTKGFELLKESLKGKAPQYSFELCDNARVYAGELDSVRNILGAKPSANRQIRGFDSNKQLCMYAEWFQEFSDWRFGRMMYLSCLLAGSKVRLEALLPELVSWLVSSIDGLRIQAVRFIEAEQGKSGLQALLPGVEQLHYRMLRIDL